MDLRLQRVPHASATRSLLLALLVAACQHGDPIASGDPEVATPRTSTEPTQLTYSDREDLAPAWQLDGGGIGYGYVELLHGRDRCLGVLPPDGGNRRIERCPTNDLAGDSVDALAEIAFGPDGQVAWVEAHSLGERITPDRGAIVVGTLDGHGASRVVQSLPYLASTGSIHATATHLRWLSRDRLAYIGTDVGYVRQCNGCKLDTIPLPKEIMILDLAAGTAPSPVPGTAEATSLWPSPDSLSLYYTIAGDSRIWLQPVAGGPAGMVHDFGAQGIARDVSRRGTRLAAIVGGRVAYQEYPPLGFWQPDRGGTLHLLDLVSGAEDSLPVLGRNFRRGVLSPDGTRIVAEGLDTVQANPDLWLFRLP